MHWIQNKILYRSLIDDVVKTITENPNNVKVKDKFMWIIIQRNTA
jgi:hypothetical protein